MTDCYFPQSLPASLPGPPPKVGCGNYGSLRSRGCVSDHGERASADFSQNCNRSQGFSLIELLVVLILIGIMAGVTGPAVGRFLNTLAVKKQTEQVMSAIRYARLRAISRGRLLVMSVTEGEEGRSFTLSGAVNEVRPLHFDEDTTLEVNPGELVFLPEGYATPGKLTLKNGGLTEVIEIDPLTALPMLEKDE